MITKQQEIRMDISSYRCKLRNAPKDYTGDALKERQEFYSLRIQELQVRLDKMKETELKTNNTVVTPKPKRFHYDPQGHYYEIWIDGELFLECTSCSADGPGNCSCWSC